MTGLLKIEYTGVRMGRATIERIIYEYYDKERDYEIVSRVQPLILTLAAPQMQTRLDLALWALEKAKAGHIFILLDVSAIQVGQYPHKKPKVSMPKGKIDQFKYALPI